MTENDNLHYAFQENLERLMNVDRLRMAIYSFWAGLSGVLLAALMTQRWDFHAGVWVFLFLSFISVATFIINRRIKDHVIEFTAKLKEIAEEMQIGKYYTDGANQKSKLTLRNIYMWVPLSGAIGFFICFVVQLIMLITDC